MLLIALVFQIISFCALGTIIELAVKWNQSMERSKAFSLIWFYFFSEWSSVQFGYPLQVVSARTEISKNVCFAHAKMSNTPNTFGWWLQRLEYGHLHERNYPTQMLSWGIQPLWPFLKFAFQWNDIHLPGIVHYLPDCNVHPYISESGKMNAEEVKRHQWRHIFCYVVELLKILAVSSKYITFIWRIFWKLIPIGEKNWYNKCIEQQMI